MNETRYPVGTVKHSAIKYVADFYDGQEFITLPGVFKNLEAALIALKQDD